MPFINYNKINFICTYKKYNNIFNVILQLKIEARKKHIHYINHVDRL